MAADVTGDAVDAAAAVRRGELTAEESIERRIGSIRTLNGALNSVITDRADRALHELATGPELLYRGVAILLKDLHAEEEGEPYHVGMDLLRRLDWRASSDSHLVRRLTAAGFSRLGRTNTPELGLMATTEPRSYGPTRNPWDPTRSVGGSSGGSAAAVAAGMVPIAHGTDTAGSVRIPAGACGVFGLKPSRGRVSSGATRGDSLGVMDTDGFLARTVRDLAAVLDVVAGPMPGDVSVAPPLAEPLSDVIRRDPPRLRVGLLTQAPFGRRVAEQCSSAAAHAARLLEEAGHAVEEVNLHALEDSARRRPLMIVAQASVAAELASWSAVTGSPIGPDDVEPLTWALAEAGRTAGAQQLHLALDQLGDVARAIESWWSTGFDLLITPTTPGPAGLLGLPEQPLDVVMDRTGAAISFTQPFNITGQPALSVPGPWMAEGVPVGVQLVGPPGRDDLVLAVGAQLERGLPALAWPPLSVVHDTSTESMT